MKSDVDVGHLLGHAARGFGEQREVGGADAALVVQTPQPPLGPVDEVGTRAEPELAEADFDESLGQLVRRPVGYTGRKRGVRHRRSAGRVRHVDRQRIPQNVLRSGVRASVHHEGARVASARRNHACFRICQNFSAAI